LKDEADREQNAEEIMKNIQLCVYLFEKLQDFRKEQPNLVHTTYQTAAGPIRVEKLEPRANTSLQVTSDVEKEQLRRDLRAAEEKIERLESELIFARKLLEDKEADAVRRACKLRIKELVEREVGLRVIQKEQNVSDENSSETDDVTAEGDITEHESLCRELNESGWNSYWESVDRAEERFTIEGTSSRSAGAAATCGNCEEGAASSTSVPSAATSEDGSTGREPLKCPICLRGFSTQEVGTPESCDHSF
jgi:hypothetical protein